MNSKEQILVENNLFKAICAFHDCDEKEKRETYTREYFLEFCEQYKINPDEALDIVNKWLDEKRKNTIFKYEHFKNLREIIFPEDKGEKKSVRDDDDAR